jgi:glycosyltransferase involved in cell wall biosynthesis
MPSRLIIDMRCLQNPDYAERGIGNHARCLVTHAPAPFTGIVDPHLPPLPEDLKTLAATLSPHAYLPHTAPGAIFLNPSPMGPDQNFLARLLRAPAITKAACIHDFIPFDNQATYLTHPATRLDYFAAMAWLRRYDVFFPNSDDTNARLRALYGPVAAHVTGVALPPWMDNLAPEPPRHILMIGGDDPRKNPEVLLRAHAASPILRQIPLIITGHYNAQAATRFAEITEVQLPARLSNADLRRLYAQALCVVTPSRTEGFSLPVIEAMAAQTPSVASDIPAHRALIPDAALRFAPDDAPALTAILEKLVTTPAYRRQIIAGQSKTLQNFTPDAVAARLWTTLAPKKPAITHTKPRLAMLTPLPPTKSGIADYSAALATCLAPLAGLTLFSGKHISAFAHTSPKFDRVISVIGNSPLHADIHDLAIRWGSTVICHDSRLLGLATGRGLEHAAAIASRELHRPVTPAEIEAWAQNENLREASFLGGLAAAARPLIFHSLQPALLTRDRFGIASKHLPFAIQRNFAASHSKQTARDALNFTPDQKVIASFGFTGTNKGIPTILHGFAMLLETTQCRLIFVGEPTGETQKFQALAARLGIAHAVAFGADFVSEETYRNHLIAADCAIQLREGGPGNISGTLQDCITAGLPAVANQDLAGNLSAPSYIKRIPDRLDPAQIAAALGELLESHLNTEPERLAYCENHSMARYAQTLLEILEV